GGRRPSTGSSGASTRSRTSSPLCGPDELPRPRERGRGEVELERVARDEWVEAELECLLEVRVQHDREPRQTEEVDDDVPGQDRADRRGESPVPALLGETAGQRRHERVADEIPAGGT